MNVSTIGTFFTGAYAWIRTHALAGALIGLGLMILLNISQRSTINKQNQELAINTQNIGALTDTLRATKNRQGKIEYNQLAFVAAKISDLEKSNKELANEIKNIKGDVKTIIKTDIKVVHDTVSLGTTSAVTDSTVKINFNLNKTYSPGNYRIREGYTDYNSLTKESNASLTRDETGITATTGIKKLNGKYQIFFQSDYPGLSVNSLTGADIDPSIFSSAKAKTKHLSIGLQAGYHPLYYNLTTKQFGVANQLSAGIGFNYKF